MDYERLVNELSDKQKLLNTYGNTNTALNRLFDGFQNKKELVTAFKILLNKDNHEELFSTLNEFKTIYMMKSQIEDVKNRVKEIRKELDI